MEPLAVLFEDLWVIVGLDIARWIPRISHRVGEMRWRKGTDVDLGRAHIGFDASGGAAVDEHADSVCWAAFMSKSRLCRMVGRPAEVGPT
jgi:hypothetical protein